MTLLFRNIGWMERYQGLCDRTLNTTPFHAALHLVEVVAERFVPRICAAPRTPISVSSFPEVNDLSKVTRENRFVLEA